MVLLKIMQQHAEIEPSSICVQRHVWTCPYAISVNPATEIKQLDYNLYVIMYAYVLSMSVA